jgi:NADH-quinone oxidoreductase subunit M
MSWHQQAGFPILSVITYLPLVGVALIMLFGKGRPLFYKVVSLVVTLAALALAVVMLAKLHTALPGMQFTEDFVWIKRFNIHYGFGVDGISALLIFLTTLLGAIVIISSWYYVKDRERGFFASLLLLQVGMTGVFCATDIFLFYVFWEAMLIPMYFIIGIWGGPRKIYAAIKFFLFTLVGSLLMLVAIIALVYYAKTYSPVGLTFNIEQLSHLVLPYHLQFWAFLAFFLAFAIKVPMWPVHTWLPDAHVEAPTAGSVILAGVLLKMGGYGMLRLCLPIFPDAAVSFIPVVVALSIVAIIYGALVSMMQKDLKKLVAYSSVSHMGFVTLGIFVAIAVARNAQGMEGAILVMFSHGLLTGALFLMVGFMYERTHTREISAMGQLATPLPILAGFFLFFTLGSLGLPGLSGFVGEFLSLLGLFQYSHVLAAVAAVGVILAACYLLWMFQRVAFNDRGDAEVKPAFALSDFTAREIASLVPLVVLAIWVGVYPDTFLNLLHVPVQQILDRVLPSVAQAHGGPLAHFVDYTKGIF